MRRLAMLIIGIMLLTAVIGILPDIISSTSKSISDYITDFSQSIGSVVKEAIDPSSESGKDLDPVIMEIIYPSEENEKVVPPASTEVPGNIAVRGDRGDQVLEIQEKLSDLGYHNDSCDGIFGGKTQASVEAFQKAAGLPVTGEVDRATYDAMMVPQTIEQKSVEQKDEACSHKGLVQYDNVHPHRASQCNRCGEMISDVVLSDCDVCFSQDFFYRERAMEMAELCLEVYEMTGNGSGPNRMEIRDSKEDPKTEALIKTSLTNDGGLILTVAFEGSVDAVDDWMRDAYAMASNGIHKGVLTAMNRFLNEYVYRYDVLMQVDLENENASYNKDYSLRSILNIIKDDPRSRLRITGHSYGGGLAQCFTYFAMDLFDIPTEKIETYTFASLVPFTREFLLEENELLRTNIYNYVHTSDFVPLLGVTSEEQLKTMPSASEIVYKDGSLSVPDIAWINWLEKQFYGVRAVAGSLVENLGNIVNGAGKIVAAHVLEENVGGFTISGSDAGMIIYLKSDVRDRVFWEENAHEMDVYAELVENTSSPQYIKVIDILSEYSKEYKRIKQDYERLLQPIEDDYYVAIRRGEKWYVVDKVPENFDYLDLLSEWDQVSMKYCNEYNADEFGISSVSIVGFSPYEQPAGDVPTAMMNGKTAVPVSENRVHDKAYLQDYILERQNLYKEVYG